jgi:superfamily II DNA or RNA helicase
MSRRAALQARIEGFLEHERRESHERTKHIRPEHLEAQVDVAEQLCDRLLGRERAPAVVLAAPTGTGKTIIALTAALYSVERGRRFQRLAIVAPNRHVTQRWQQRASALGADPSSITGHTTRTLPARRFTEGTLVIIDEAHRGMQTDKTASYEGLKEACRDRAVILVSATPYQLTTAGLVAMLSLNGSRQRGDELRPIQAYAKQLAEVMRNVDSEELSDESRLRLRSSAAESRSVIDRHLIGGTHPSWDARLYQPDREGFDTIELSEAWARAYWTARALAALTTRGISDTLNRGLDSSSEAFQASRLHKALKARDTPRMKELLRTLEGELGSGIAHPKVHATVEWTREQVAAGRHVLIFTYFTATQQALKSALDEQVRDAEVHAPTGTRTLGAVTERFRRQQKPGEKPLVLVVTDKFSESIDLDGGDPSVVHHDLHWNPARIRQRMGRVTRLSSGFQRVPPRRVYLPILATPTDERMRETIQRRFALTDLIIPAELEIQLDGLPAAVRDALTGCLDGVPGNGFRSA